MTPDIPSFSLMYSLRACCVPGSLLNTVDTVTSTHVIPAPGAPGLVTVQTLHKHSHYTNLYMNENSHVMKFTR